MVKINKNLKVARKKSGLTQVEVEQKLGLRSLTIKDYETGRLKLPAEVSVKLAKLYNTEVSKLLGITEEADRPDELVKLKSLWVISPEHKMLQDPVIEDAINSVTSEIGKKPILSLLMLLLPKSKQEEFIIESIKFINSLIGIDKKIKPAELDMKNHFMAQFISVSKNAKLNHYLTEAYSPDDAPACLQNPALKHFLIWLLFFTASADKEIDYRELDYIEKTAENIQISIKSFEFISSHFKGEKVG